MDHVLGRHRELDRPPERHMQFVDFALPLRVRRLPHKLFARDEYFHRSGRRLRILKIQTRSPHKDCRYDQSGDGRPQDFERQGPFDRLGTLVRRAPPVFQHEVEDDRKNHDCEKQSDRSDEKIQMVHRPRDRGSLFGLEGDPLHQSFVLCDRALIAHSLPQPGAPSGGFVHDETSRT